MMINIYNKKHQKNKILFLNKYHTNKNYKYYQQENSAKDFK